MADVVIINKVDTADYANVLTVRQNVRALNPDAIILEAASPLVVEGGAAIRGKRVLVIEDGPTTTHGEMKYGAGVVAAQRHGAGELVDARPFAVRSIKDTFTKYPNIGTVLPAMGYGRAQMNDLADTINASDADLVVTATPIDLTRILKVNKPMVRVRYELQVIGSPTLEDLLREKFS
jgi:predicted GTPase